MYIYLYIQKYATSKYVPAYEYTRSIKYNHKIAGN